MTYTIAGTFLPEDGSAVDSLDVNAFKVSTWSGVNSPPQLGDALPGAADASGTTGTEYGNHGAWQLALPTNEDYFVAVTYASVNYWQRYNLPAWTDATTGELDVTSLTINGYSSGGIDNFDGDIAEIGTSASAGSVGLAADAGHVHPGLGQPIGLAGATEDTRYGGATSSGAPISGSFEPGDFVVDQSGAIWIYTSSSEWVEIAPASPSGLVPSGTIIPFAGPAVPAGGWLACDGSAQSRSGYADLFAAISVSFTGTLSNSSTTVTSVSSPTTLQAGWFVSGTGIPAGTYIESVGATTIVLSATPTVSGSESLIAAPWGVGDGTSTFNLPDMRGRVGVGNNGLGSNTQPAYVLAANGGEQTHQLAADESGTTSHAHSISSTHDHTVPEHGHSFYDPGHPHSVDDPGHTHAPANGAAGYYVNSGSLEFTNGTEHTIGTSSTANATTGLSIFGAYTGASVDDASAFSTSAVSPGSTDDASAAEAADAHNNMQPFAAVNYIIKT